MAWRVYPATHGRLDWIGAAHVVSDILGEGAIEERHFPCSFIEATVTKGHASFGHVYTVLKRYVVKRFVPVQSWLIALMAFISGSSEFVC